MSTKLFDVQNHLVALLKADAFFTDLETTPTTPIIPVITQRVGDLQQDIDANLARNSGLCVVVMLPKIDFEGVDQKIVLRLTFSVFVSENPTVNKVNANQPAETVMEKVFQLIHWQPNLPSPPQPPLPALARVSGPRDRMSRFQISKGAATLLPPTKENPSLVNYVLDFTTSISL